ncbi:MAG: hypothetical protein V3R73_04180 [Sphingomonadales bacterium]
MRALIMTVVSTALTMAVASGASAGVIGGLKAQADGRGMQQEGNLFEEKEPLKACKDLGLEWLTTWDSDLWTLRKLPGWADYILTISAEGEITSADVTFASGKGLNKLARSKKVVRRFYSQKITPSGSVLKCNETLFFFKHPKTGKTVLPESRCDEAQESCVKG